MTTEYGKGIAQRTCAAADRTGHAILHTLPQSLKNNVDFFIEYFVIDLVFKNGNCIGVLAWCLDDGSIHFFQSHIVILAVMVELTYHQHLRTLVLVMVME